MTKIFTLTKDKLFLILNANKYLNFYKIMNYPVPNNFFYFTWKQKIPANYFLLNLNSRTKHNKKEKSFVEEINKHSKYFKYFPFIQQIFLCNSLTFNKLNNNSDIDLFIICKSGYIRSCRFFTRLYFTIKKAKKNKKKSYKKFCLSFYITDDNLNLKDITLKPYDPYLTYRIGHLINLYKNPSFDKNLWQENKRILKFIPNHPLKQILYIPNLKTYTENSLIKLLLENFLKIINFEKFIKKIRYPIVIRKKNKLGENKKRIIISDKMLKYHKDIRKQIQIFFSKNFK